MQNLHTQRLHPCKKNQPYQQSFWEIKVNPRKRCEARVESLSQGGCGLYSFRAEPVTSYSSRTCVGINVRRAWRTIARGAAKAWEPSGPAVCKTSVAYLRKQSKLALFFARRQKFCRQTAPVLGSRNGHQNGGQVVRTQASQIETE